MKVGFIGLPQSGKSSVFAAVTGQALDPYAPAEVRQAVVRVPDPRLDVLEKMCNPKKRIEATVEFFDLPGFSLDDARGRDEFRRFLPIASQLDLFVVVVRDFENASVPAYRDRIDPVEDLEAIWSELLFADLEIVTTRIERIEAALKKPHNHDQEKKELALLQSCREALENDKPLASVIVTEVDERMLGGFSFLTVKPIVGVRNVSDDRAAEDQPLVHDHLEASITLSASIEAEIATLEPADREAFLSELGLTDPARDRLVRACYAAGGMISFLTMGADEVRAWPVRKDSTAVEAAGKIHTDLARSFIRAETIGFDELVEIGDLRSAKSAGKLRKEGKTYIVQDGDILNILAGS